MKISERVCKIPPRSHPILFYTFQSLLWWVNQLTNQNLATTTHVPDLRSDTTEGRIQRGGARILVKMRSFGWDTLEFISNNGISWKNHITKILKTIFEFHLFIQGWKSDVYDYISIKCKMYGRVYSATSTQINRIQIYTYCYFTMN